MFVLMGLASLFVSFLIGACGVGGVLLIPFLALFGQLSTHQAMATALFSFFFVGVTVTCVYQRHGSIHWKTTFPVLAGSLLSGYPGAWLGAFLSARMLDLILAGVIIFSCLPSLRAPKKICFAQRLDARGNFYLLFGIGLFTGFLCGMTGAGGGIVSTPVMLLFGYAVMPSIGTAQVLQCVVSISGSASNYSNGYIVFPLVWWVTAWEVAGVVLGARLAHSLPTEKLKYYATILCLVIGVLIVLRSL
ncbi:MAG: sulfite exporter TauE/SafE family protein [Desulfovibrio sp.]|jgi:uncharacterized membrane protein YfcA|nr:sulfite exporter TauE/SafE family protein [Desulfovibrio sp.]